MRTLLLAVWVVLNVSQEARACETVQPVEVWACAELAFTSVADHDHPIRDVRQRISFTHPSGDTLSVEGFWNGGRTWLARVALPRTGLWSWTALSAEPGLGGRAGQISVVSATGTDPFRTRGWLRVADDHRYLTYTDGSPFFYLADTAWEAAASATPEEFAVYVADRRAKGFDVVQIVVSTHQVNYPDVITNRAGQPYLLGTDRGRLNPRYFDTLDRLVRQANEAGMAVALVPLWATYASVHAATSPHVTLVSPADALLQASYIGARYAGSNVVWIVGGDQAYNTDEIREYWDAFACRLDAASGGLHLTTVHASGYQGSFSSWPVAPDWLDFHMYQGSHFDLVRYDVGADGTRLEDAYGSLRANGGFTWEGALAGYHLPDPRPVLNAEANYEDLFGRFWEFPDTTGSQRISAADVRSAAYWGLLSGSTVGYAYGANGVWQWTRDTSGGGFWSRRSALGALSFPASGQMRRFRELAEANGWSQWVPRPDLTFELDSPDYIPAALGPDVLVVYLPVGTTRFGVDVPPSFGTSLTLRWSSATSDVTLTDSARGGGYVELTPPDDQDWLLAIRSRSVGQAPPSPDDDAPTLRSGPNPARGAPRVTVRSTNTRDARLDVFDMLGRRVHTEEMALVPGDVSVRLPLSVPGVYLCRLTSGTARRHPDEAVVRLTVVQ